MQRALKIYLWPIWIVQLFTARKSFKANPILGSRLLNGLGLHLLRIVFSRIMIALRQSLVGNKVPASLRRNFRSEGICILPNLVSADQLANIKLEMQAYKGDARQRQEGSTIIQRILLDVETLNQMPELNGILNKPEFLNPLAYASANQTRSPVFLERLRHNKGVKQTDPQKTLHSDTFHSTMKAWLFLADVGKQDGPFSYVRGSNRLSWARLKWEYKRSLIAAKLNDGHSEDGSFRVTANDLKEMHLPEPELITVSAGTLVIANTNGFHRRSEALADATRLCLWTSFRPNPFSLWPGLAAISGFDKKCRTLQAKWKRLDKKAHSQGKKSNFYKVDAKILLD